MQNTKLRIKRKLKKYLGHYNHLKKGVACKSVWYGQNYAGFFVNPDLIHKNSIVYSIGIGENISFDLDIIQNHNCQVFAFDPTPKSINWVKQQGVISNFNFNNYGISDKTGYVDFFLPKNPEHVSGSIHNESSCVNENSKVSVPMKTLSDITNELGHNRIDVLKMDIEGSEYDVIDDILNSKIEIHQILIEFHDRFFENGKQRTMKSISALKKHGFEIFAVSDTFEEISFIKKSLIS